MAKLSGLTETKNVVNSRVEIDTSPPFESVKEAVDRFGGSGPWIPLRSAVVGNEDHVIQLEKDLIKKEHQTLHILKELEASKRLVEGLKTNSSSFTTLKLENKMTNSMFAELNQAKLNLNKTSEDLVVIQASVESLNKKMNQEKLLHERRTKSQIPIKLKLKPASFEAEQFKSMTEASRYEVVKAMTEIERTKNSIKMAEMRLNAAKKMEEAAKAVQAITLAEKKCSLMNNTDGITLSFEEYRALSRKAQQSEGMCRTKFIEVPVLEKFEDLTHGDGNESHAKKEELTSGLRKVVAQDDVTDGRHVENHLEGGHVSLSQMLKEQSRLILYSPKTKANGTVEKKYVVQRKKFGFMQVPIPTLQSKKKTQGLEMK